VHAKQRLGIEIDHEAQILGQGINFFHPENWYSIYPLYQPPSLAVQYEMPFLRKSCNVCFWPEGTFWRVANF
jgi:hypothetical protein